MRQTIFDIEVFPNWWCVVYTDPDDSNILKVARSDKEGWYKELKQLVSKTLLIGFNIKGYDLRVLNCILDGNDAYRVYDLSQNIISDGEDRYNNYYFWNKFVFTDLYDDWRYGSLKEFESNSGMNIKESDIPFDKPLTTEEEKQETIDYCKQDVRATVKLLSVRTPYINSKKVLSKMFNIPLSKALKSTNAKLSALILDAELKHRVDSSKYVIPEKVRNYVIDNIPKDIVALFDVIRDRQQEKDDEIEKTVTLFENTVVFGVGGIHSTYSDNLLTRESEQYGLLNIDVTSYYPNLLIVFDYMSRSAKLRSLYKQIYDMRVDLKRQAKQEEKTNGKTPLYYELNEKQEALKLVLNTVYGAMKNKYNGLYDVYNASSLCYTGQLLLTALANKLYNNVNFLKIIQTNTDGILIKYRKDTLAQVQSIVKEWETLTELPMEYEDVKMFLQRDVNNYIELTHSSKMPVKLKGKWGNQADVDNNSYEQLSNLNAPITHTALVNYYTKGIPVRDTIEQCNDALQFCFTTKMGYTFKKVYYEFNNQQHKMGKVNRVVATTDNRCGTLHKIKIVDGEERYHKIAEIPEKCWLMNKEPKMIKTLDREWYIQFTENKIKELIEV